MSSNGADAGLEREWVSLIRRIRLARGFCFIVYFVFDYDAADEFKRRLREGLPRRGTTLVEIDAARPSEIVDVSLSALFAAGSLGTQTGTKHLYWLEAVRGAGDPDWDTERARLLSRLNERRSRLESELDGPLILLLPAGAVREIATHAPDLWHVRTYSGELRTGPEGAGGSQTLEAPIVMDLALPPDLGVGDADDGPAPSRFEPWVDDPWPYHLGTAPDSVEPLFQLRLRARGAGSGYRGFDIRVRNAQLRLHEGRLSKAREEAELGADMIARLSNAAQHKRFDVEAARAVALLITGIIAHASGDPEGAEAPLRASLQVLEPRGGERAAQALDALGRVRLDQARHDEAMDVFMRLERSGRSANDLRRVAVARVRQAMVHTAQGNFRAATSLLESCLLFARDAEDKPAEAVLLTELGGVLLKDGAGALGDERFDQSLLCVDPNAPATVRTGDVDAGNIALRDTGMRGSAPTRDAYSAAKIVLLSRQAILCLDVKSYERTAERVMRRAQRLYDDEERRRREADAPPMSGEQRRMATVLGVLAAVLARLKLFDEALGLIAQARLIYLEWGDERGEWVLHKEEERIRALKDRWLSARPGAVPQR